MKDPIYWDLLVVLQVVRALLLEDWKTLGHTVLTVTRLVYMLWSPIVAVCSSVGA